MFEVVSTKRERRASLHRTATAICSVAVHLAIVTGLALLPRSALRHARAPREVPVTYFDIPVLHTPTGNTRSGAPAGSTLPDPSRQAAKQLRDEFAALRQASVPNRVEQAVPRVAGAPGGGGIATDTVATTLLSSLAEAARTRASEAAKREPVDLSALSELPRLSNPRTMAGWWTELYPTRLLLRGIEGEAVVLFAGVFFCGFGGRGRPRHILFVEAAFGFVAEPFAIEHLREEIRQAKVTAFVVDVCGHVADDVAEDVQSD